MVLKPATAKILDLETTFDAVPVPSAEGDVIWADVRIEYKLSGLNPTVTIRVPVPWEGADTAELRKSKALRCARQLIDHACRAAGVASAEEPSEGSSAEDALDATTPNVVSGALRRFDG